MVSSKVEEKTFELWKEKFTIGMQSFYQDRSIDQQQAQSI